MTVTTREPLGEGTLVRKWYLDVNTGTYSSPVWTGVFGITEFTPSKTPTKQDDSDFESEGWKSEGVTALAWSLKLKVLRKTDASDATEYDAGQEVLRAASDKIGSDNYVDVRWYEYCGDTGGPEVEAYRGYASVEWNPDGGAMDAYDSVSVVLSGRGKRTAITHPAAEASAPSVVSITPATGLAEGGEAALIYGQYFTGATAVKIGTTDVTDYVVADDRHISIITPAKDAGPYIVYVTNATGTNSSGPIFTYTSGE